MQSAPLRPPHRVRLCLFNWRFDPRLDVRVHAASQEILRARRETPGPDNRNESAKGTRGNSQPNEYRWTHRAKTVLEFLRKGDVLNGYARCLSRTQHWRPSGNPTGTLDPLQGLLAMLGVSSTACGVRRIVRSSLATSSTIRMQRAATVGIRNHRLRKISFGV